MSSKITLKSTHLFLDKEVVTRLFSEVTHVYLFYHEGQHQILITPVTSQWFKKMHKPEQYILKARNLEGDKTIDIGGILIDNDLDETDKELEYEIIDKTELLKITM
ncbi:MAG: hypothetical protein ABIO60_05840 [Aquaticitalea sp.]